MDAKDILKVHVTLNGRRYTASLAGEEVLILGSGRALATAIYRDGRLTGLRPTPPDFLVQMPEEDFDAIDMLGAELRAAGADLRAARARAGSMRQADAAG